jgi:hypothetical protein
VKGISIQYRGYCNGVFEVRTAWDGETLGEIPVVGYNVWTENGCECQIPDGVNAIYLVFRGTGTPQLRGFELVC